ALNIGNSGALALGVGQPTLQFANVTLNDSSAIAIEGSLTVTLGPNLTISQAANTSGRVGTGYAVSGTPNLTTQCLIQAATTGSVLAIEPSGTLTNAGTWLAATGGRIFVPTSSTLTNISGATLTGGNYTVDAGSTMDFNGRTVSTIGPGT